MLNEKYFAKAVSEITKDDVRDVQYVLDVYHELLRVSIIGQEEIKITNLYTIDVVDCKGKLAKNNKGIWTNIKPYKKIKVTPSMYIKKAWKNLGIDCEDSEKE